MALSEQRKTYLAGWRAKNREKIRESQQKYYESNKEICNQRAKDCQAKKRSYYSAKTIEWQKNNRERYLENRRKNYAMNSAREIERTLRRLGKIRHGELLMTHAEKTEVQGLYDFCRIFRGFEVDHIVPLNGKNVSGLHILANLQVLPIKENRSKSNKFMEAQNGSI